MQVAGTHPAKLIYCNPSFWANSFLKIILQNFICPHILESWETFTQKFSLLGLFVSLLELLQNFYGAALLKALDNRVGL